MPEPTLRVGLLDGVGELGFELRGRFDLETAPGSRRELAAGHRLRAVRAGTGARLEGVDGAEIATAARLRVVPRVLAESSFLVHGMTVGVRFHWQHDEDLVFRGALALEPHDDGITAIDEVPLETYLASVISSEMSASCPAELLRAHAVISRSWLLAQLESAAAGGDGGRGSTAGVVEEVGREGGVPLTRIRRWYDRQDHARFDVCADDHCQRYHGITRAASAEVEAAVAATRGLALVAGSRVCDARFAKCCGGMTELFSSAWGDRDLDYLQAFPDAAPDEPPPFALPLTDERLAAAFIAARPRVWCGQTDPELLARILPDIDHRTRDFFRWRVTLGQDELRHLVAAKSGIDPGPIQALRPLERGPSGRIVRLRIDGARHRLEVGKELEIRRLLSATHLYSSTFVVESDPCRTPPSSFTLHGAGWGHGVGLCQIGAAVMAERGHDHRQILAHYYRGAALDRRY